MNQPDLKQWEAKGTVSRQPGTRGGREGDATGSGVEDRSVLVGHRATATDREGILRRLHADRRELNRKRRESELSAGETAFLADIEQEIDYWEEQARASGGHSEIMARFEELAARVLKLADASKGV